MSEYNVLAIEEGEGKYVVAETFEDTYIFAGLLQARIGGHSAITRMLRDAQEASLFGSEYTHDCKRATVVKALDMITGMDEISGAVGGGKYELVDRKLRLYGQSKDFGPVSKDLLKAFEEPLRAYFQEQGQELEELVIE